MPPLEVRIRVPLRAVVLALRGLLGKGHGQYDGHDLELFHRPVAERAGRDPADLHEILIVPFVAEALVPRRPAVFVFPTHDWSTAYTLPEDEVAAFERVIGPRIREAA